MSAARQAAGNGADLLLASGGSGGHIYPALAVAGEAKALGLKVMFLGQKGGMEERLVPAAGVDFTGVAAGKWHRGSPRAGQAIQAAAGVVQAWQAVRRIRPRVALGFGGFASFPGSLAALNCGVPLALYGGDAFPSKVNRWLAPRAQLVIVAQAEALTHLRRVRRSLVVPYPVRERREQRGPARARLGLPPQGLVTLVMGGSQGSATLNREVPAAYRELLASLKQTPRPESAGATGEADAVLTMQVLHAAGHGNAAALRASTAGWPNYHVFDYLDAPDAWAAADLAITRAGIGTISEAAFNGVPLVMVPLPSSAEDHQLHNARAVEAVGAGLVVEEQQLAGLVPAWRELLQPRVRSAAAAAAKARSPDGAARKILDAVMELT